MPSSFQVFETVLHVNALAQQRSTRSHDRCPGTQVVPSWDTRTHAPASVAASAVASLAASAGLPASIVVVLPPHARIVITKREVAMRMAFNTASCRPRSRSRSA